MAFVFLILVFFIDQRGVSDKHCLWPFFSFKLSYFSAVMAFENLGILNYLRNYLS